MAFNKPNQMAMTLGQPQPILWRPAIQQHDKAYLYTLCLSSTDTGLQIIQKAKSMLERVMHLHLWSEIFFFKHLIVETASLTPVRGTLSSLLFGNSVQTNKRLVIVLWPPLGGGPKLTLPWSVSRRQPTKPCVHNCVPQAICFYQHGEFRCWE